LAKETNKKQGFLAKETYTEEGCSEECKRALVVWGTFYGRTLKSRFCFAKKTYTKHGSYSRSPSTGLLGPRI